MLSAFLNSVKTGKPAPIPSVEIFHNTLATFAVLDSLRLGKEISLF